MYVAPVSKWYVVYTYPSFEKKVQHVLLRRNILCFLPLQKVLRQWSDRKKIMEVPLFPNYIFVHVMSRERFEVLDVPGVSRYVTYNGMPATISEQEIMKIKKLMADPGVTVEQYLEGDMVKIMDGPFEGLTGVVFERKGKSRFGVKIEAINQSLSVEFNTAAITKIKQEETAPLLV